MEEDDSLSSLKVVGPSPPSFGTDGRVDIQGDGGTDSALSMGYRSTSEDVEDRIRRDGHDPNSMTDTGKIAFLVEQLQITEHILVQKDVETKTVMRQHSEEVKDIESYVKHIQGLSEDRVQEIVDELEELRRENQELHQRLSEFDDDDDDDDDNDEMKRRETGKGRCLNLVPRESMIEEGLDEIADASPKEQLEWLLAERRKWTNDLEEELKAGGGRGGTSLLTVPTEPFAMRHSASTGNLSLHLGPNSDQSPNFGSRASLAQEEVEEFEEEIRQQREAAIRVKEQMSEEFESEKTRLKGKIEELEERESQQLRRSDELRLVHDATEEKNRRLNDRMSEMETSLKEAQSQREEARISLKEARMSEEEARKSEAEARHESERKSEELAAVKNSVFELKRDRDNFDEKISRLESEKKILLSRIEEEKARVNEAREEAAKAKADAAAKASAAAVTDSNSSSTADAEDLHRKQLKVLEDRAEALQKQLLKQKIDSGMKENRLQEQIDKLREEEKKWEEERKESEEERKEMEDERKEMEEDAKASEGRCETLKEEKESLERELTDLRRRSADAETKSANHNASSAAVTNANTIELKSANKEMARKLSEVQQQLEASKVALKEEKSRGMSLIVEKNEQVASKDGRIEELKAEAEDLRKQIVGKETEMKLKLAEAEEDKRKMTEMISTENKRRSNSSSALVERLSKEKENLEKRVKEISAQKEEATESLEEAEERTQEMERKVAAARQTEREKDDRHERLMAKLKELEKKNFELLETAKMAETHKQADNIDTLMVRRLEEKNAEYRQKWREEEVKSEELKKLLRSAQMQVDELKSKLISTAVAKTGKDGGGDDEALVTTSTSNSSTPSTGKNVVEDLRRDLVGAARDLCCRILDHLIDKCEKTAISAAGSFEGAVSKVVSPEEVVNASIVLREDKIIEIVAQREREAKKSKDELKEAKRMLEEEEQKWEERNKERTALRHDLETVRGENSEQADSLWRLQEEIGRLQKDLAAADREAVAADRRLQSADVALMDAKAELERREGQLLELKEREMTRLQREKEAAEEELREERKETQRIKEEKRRAEERLEREKTELMEEAERGKEKERELEKAKRKMEERAKSVEIKEREGRTKEKEVREGMERKILILEKELDETKRGSLKVKATLESAKDDLASLHAEEVEGLCFQLKKANDRVRDLTAELERIETRDRDRRAKEEVEEEEWAENLKLAVETKAAELKRVERKLRKTEGDLEEKEAERKQMERKAEDRRHEMETARKERDAVDAKCRRLEAKLTDMRKQVEGLKRLSSANRAPSGGGGGGSAASQRRGVIRGSESMTSLDSAASNCDSFHAGVVKAAFRFELEAKKEEIIKLHSTLNREKTARQQETRAKTEMASKLEDASENVLKLQREINAKRHALLDAEAKIETGSQRSKELAKELEGNQMKLKETEESLTAKAEEVALLQMALTKASGKKTALTAKYRRWRREGDRELRDATEALETERIELTELLEKAREDAATSKMKLEKEKELRSNIEGKQERLHEEMRDYLLQLQEKEEALNSKTMSANLLEKKLKGLEGENRRLLDALKTFGRRNANNAVNATHLVGGIASTGIISSGVIGGSGVTGAFGAVASAPLGISRPFRTVTPLHRGPAEMNQLSVQVNEGTTGVDSNPSPSSDLSTQTTSADTTSANTTSNVHSLPHAPAPTPAPNSVNKAPSGVPANVPPSSRVASPPTLSASSASSASPPSANQCSGTPSANQNRPPSSKLILPNQSGTSNSPHSRTQEAPRSSLASRGSAPTREGRDSSSAPTAPPRTKTALVTPMGSEMDATKSASRTAASRIPTSASRPPSGDAATAARRRGTDGDIPATLL